MVSRPAAGGSWRMSESEPRFLAYARPPEAAPNVVVVVLDDVGFAQLGCFGSPIRTPTIDALAARGLRYRCFHVTSICSSTRAALLTGRNHHAVGVGMTMETPLGFPGYTGRLPASAATLARVLADAGYNTFAVGKWHLCPRGEYSAAGPTTRWPLGLGFERFYGFLGAETNQWAPELCRDNTFVDPPQPPSQGYHLSEDLVDQAIRMVQDQKQAAPTKPFFCYLAFGAAHAPHQVPEQWSQAYRGAFDAGWEELRHSIWQSQKLEGLIPANARLTERPAWVKPWSQLSVDQRRLYCRYMEAFAGFLSHADAQLGRFVRFLEELGCLEHTLVLVLSDNGASAEGGPTGTLNEPLAWMGLAEPESETLARLEDIGGQRAFNHYPWGWAWAGNTPFRLWKRYAWLGGVRAPLVVHWPGRLDSPGSVRPQFCHVIDLYPTILEAVGLDSPQEVDGVAQQPVDGASLLATFADPGAPAPRRTQYFEMHGSRSIYHDGWKATTDYVSPLFGERAHLTGSRDLDHDHWSLFDLEEDFSEAIDLAARHSDKVEELVQLWWSEAERNRVLPLFDSPAALSGLHPGPLAPPAEAVYRPGGNPINEAALPALTGGFVAEAELEVPAGCVPTGVVCALGDLNEGWVLCLLEGRPMACLVSGRHRTRVEASQPLLAGVHRLTVAFTPGGGPGENLVVTLDGRRLAGGHHPFAAVFPAVSTAGGGLLVGRDRGLAVTDDYTPPFPLRGAQLRWLRLAGQPGSQPDPEASARRAVASD